jgi:AraC-like DNA-binding protein
LASSTRVPAAERRASPSHTRGRAASLGRSLHEEIRRAHVARAQELLVQTDLPMPAVADHAGFSDARQLATVFRIVTGKVPTVYRAQSRCGAAGR